ncbi:LysR family transcriptional regulator [Phyllobacterium sp. 22552]|uniref:LysR family transcriptional regulator n=1 Tax=Phyllobacterium sp. 22552 TaxID=3453941 RepID=UPI003F83F111
MDRLLSMAVFVKAVDLGSFAAAAEELGLSGPMVGKHIRFLEERLGLRLLNRTTRRQSLTDFGHVYYESCHIILAEVDATDAQAADQLLEPRGKLRVTMPVHFGRRCVTPVLLELARKYPALELDLSYNDDFYDLAENGFDLAVRTGAPEDRAGVIARRIARQEMIVCGSPSYLEKHGKPEQIIDLNQHQAIMYRRSGRIPPWSFPGGETLVPINRIRLDDLDAIADAASSGIGLAWLPSWLVRDRLQEGTLVQLLSDQPGLPYDCYAMWLQTPHLSLKVRIAVDALAIALPKMM